MLAMSGSAATGQVQVECARGKVVAGLACLTTAKFERAERENVWNV